jgi:hypothetical protein
MRSANLIWQSLVVLHRYLGVAVGLLMVMWFVSGIIMMYVGLPRVTDEERARTLEPIAWQACCRFRRDWRRTTPSCSERKSRMSLAPR